MMDTVDALTRLALAFGIGMLIGLERGWQMRGEADGERTAGLRTLALSGLLGGIVALLSKNFGAGGGLFLGLVSIAYAAVIGGFRLREAIDDDTFGVTTVVAALIVYLLGALAVLGDMQVAAAAAVVTAVVLATKAALHGWLRKLTWRELRAALVLLTMTVVLLPLLPNRTIDPWQAINPYELWLLTIMIAAISFAGYIALKLTPERTGVLLTAVAGGLASSTAVTMTMAGLAQRHPDHARVLAGGVLVAGAVMLVRVLVIVAALDQRVLGYILLPLALAAVALTVSGYLLSGRNRGDATGDDDERLLPDNPFELSTVLKFGVLLTVITFIAKVVTAWAGQAGAYVVAAISGIVDVDALTLSMVRLAPSDVSYATAAYAIATVTTVNTISKTVLAWVTGGAGLGKPVAAGSLVAIIVMWLAILFFV